MPRTISCLVCGVNMEVQRLSARYCRDCKPKALVLNTVIRQLNRLVNIDNEGFRFITSIEDRTPDELMDAFEVLEGRTTYGILDVLNIALAEYGRIAYDGHEFVIKPWAGARTLRLSGLRAHINTYEEEATFPAEPYGAVGVDPASPSGDDSVVAVAFQNPNTGSFHIYEHGRGASETRRSVPVADVEAWRIMPTTPSEWDEVRFEFVTRWVDGYADGGFTQFLRERGITYETIWPSAGAMYIFKLQDGRIIWRGFEREAGHMFSNRQRAYDQGREFLSDSFRSRRTREVREAIARGDVNWDDFIWLEYLFNRGDSIRSEVLTLQGHSLPDSNMQSMQDRWLNHYRHNPMSLEEQNLRLSRNNQGRISNIQS